MENFISTATIPKFNFINPKPEDIHISDIANALALTCRFGGHCSTFYSVAEHSIVLAGVLEDEKASDLTVLAALLHDAEEAYLPDIPRPIKNLMPEAMGIYYTIQNAIEVKYGLGNEANLTMWNEIHDIDRKLCITEAKALGIWNDQWEDFGDLPKVKFYWLQPPEVEEMFLRRYAILRDRL